MREVRTPLTYADIVAYIASEKDVIGSLAAAAPSVLLRKQLNHLCVRRKAKGVGFPQMDAVSAMVIFAGKALRASRLLAA
jgi:hypothetical protein